MKDKSLQLLTLIATKRNGDADSRGCTYGGYQREHANTRKFSSPTLGFYVFRCACDVIEKENKYAETSDLLELFLQTEIDTKYEQLLPKLIVVVTFLLEELDESK